MILSTAPPLYLDPVKDVEEAQALMDKLSDPLCCRDPPAPKSRKRTVAELAADEALAAEEQRFMLIMDERLVPSTTASGTGKAVGTDSEGNGTNFEARFESFKILEEMKETLREREKQAAQQNEEAKQQKAKAEQERAQEQRVQMANARRQEHQALRNTSLHQNTGGSQQHQQPPQPPQQQSQPQQQHLGSTQPQAPPVSTHHAHPSVHGTIPPNPHQLTATQGPQSSPVVRNMTPQNASSPAMGSAMNRGPSAVQMNMTNSAQGAAGSPPRPGSAIPHSHPGPIPMAAQRSQQPPSRNGTPSMPNGTPRLQQATPVMRNITPTPRMSQASPVNSASAATPLMGHNMLGTAHMNVQQQGTPQQHQAFLTAQQQHQARQHQLRQAYQQQHMHGSPPNIQLSQQHFQQMAAQQQAQQRAGYQPHNQEAYRQMLQSVSQQQQQQQQQQQMHAQPGNQAMMNRMMMQQGQNPVGNQQVNFGGHPMGNMGLSDTSRRQVQAVASKMFEQMRLQAMQQHGPELPHELVANMRATAINNARNMLVQQQQRKNLAQQQAAMNHMHQNGAMNGMGGL